jgi:hypothetical protein
MLKWHFLLFRPEGDGDGSGGGTGDGSQGGSGTGSQADDGGTQGGSSGSDMVPRSEAQEARREAQSLRNRLKAAEEARAALEREKLSDSEKIVQERDDAVKAASDANLRVREMQVQVLAQDIGIVDPEAASRLLDWDKIKNPDDRTQVEKALRDLVKDKSYLIGHAGKSDGGAGDGSGGQGTSMNDLIRGAAGR